MRVRARMLVVACIAGAFALAGVTSSAQIKTTEIAVSAHPDTLSLTFRTGRTQQTRTIALTGAKALPSATTFDAELLGDLVRQDGQESFPKANFSVSAVGTTSDDQVDVKVTATSDGVRGGVYDGFLRVRAPGITTMTIPVKATVQQGSWLSAIIALGLGLIIGAMLKWYADIGKRLGAARRRFETLHARLSGLIMDLPKDTRAQFRLLQKGLEHLDPAQAESALSSLDATLDASLPLARLADDARGKIDHHEDLIARLDGVVADIPKVEREAVSRLLKTSDLTVGAARLKTLCEALDEVTRILVAKGQSADSRPHEKPFEAAGLTEVLAMLKSGASTRLRATVAVEKPKPDDQPSKKKSLRERVRAWRKKNLTRANLVTKAGPWFIASLTLALLGVYGFMTQFTNNPTFGANGRGDVVGLFIWGVATSITGKTVGDFFAQLSGRSAAPAAKGDPKA